MNTTFIYTLCEPGTRVIRYVGKSDNPKRRLFYHISESKKLKKTDHKNNWIRSLSATPVLEILDEVPIEHWQQWEVAYIEFFREQGCNLVNSTPGGNGGLHSFEAVEKMRLASTGHHHSLETRQKISRTLRGNKNSLGHEVPLDTRKKMSVACLGQKKSLETRSKMSAAKMGNKNCLGYKHTPETRAKVSAAGKLRKGTMTGRVASEETRKKISVACLGRKISEETRTKMRAAATLREAKKRGEV